MTDFDLCVQALEQKGIDYEIKTTVITGLFRVVADTYPKQKTWFFYYYNGKEYKP